MSPDYRGPVVIDTQVRVVKGLDRSDSQADSAGSIPVTRSIRNPRTSKD